MKKNLVIAILAGACVFMGYQLNAANNKVADYAEFTKEQKAMMEAYEERLHLADTTIIEINSKIAEHLRNGILDEEGAAYYLERTAKTWKRTQ